MPLVQRPICLGLSILTLILVGANIPPVRRRAARLWRASPPTADPSA